MQRMAVALYGVVSYAVFLVAFLYAIGFVGNLAVPKSIDSGPVGDTAGALIMNLVLLGLFAIQHTIMARPKFKQAFTKIVPVAAERSTFVLATSLLLLLLYWKWVPMDGTIWDLSGSVGGTVLTVLFWAGWGLVFVSTFLINHFDLFGLRQVYLNLTGGEYRHPPFQTTGLYGFIRHPIMLGFIIAFWATPTMTTGHLLFAVMTTGYILVGIQFEERTLQEIIGAEYGEYRKRVPMLIPFTK